MERFKDWEIRLHKKFLEWSEVDFQWGEKDCCIFAGDCIEAITSKNPMTDFIKKYSNNPYTNKREAILLIKNSFSDLGSCIEQVLGKPRDINFAQRGDLVLLKNNNSWRICGIVDLTGAKITALSLKDGLVKLPMSDGYLSWKI